MAGGDQHRVGRAAQHRHCRSGCRSIVESLAPATVHVVLTARDLARVLPSTWQENIQNGLTWTWPEFLASVMGCR